MSDIVTEQQTSRVPVKLDIRKKEGTKEFDCSKSDRTATYKAKKNFVFSQVKQSKRPCDTKGMDVILWETNSQEEYARKVIVSGIHFKTKDVTIYLINGKIKRFHKEKNQPWSEYIPKIPVELDIMIGFTTNEFLYSFDPSRKISTYITKCFFAFSLVKQSALLLSCFSLVIWNAKDKTEYANKVEVTGFGSKTKYVTVYILNGKTKVFGKDKNSRWIEYNGKIPIGLFIGFKKSNTHVSYSYNKSTNVGTYIAKPNYLFSEVKEQKGLLHNRDSDKLIWEAKVENDFAYKVVVKSLSSKNKEVTIYLIKGLIKVFAKDKNSPWHEVTDLTDVSGESPEQYESDLTDDSTSSLEHTQSLPTGVDNVDHPSTSTHPAINDPIVTQPTQPTSQATPETSPPPSIHSQQPLTIPDKLSYPCPYHHTVSGAGSGHEEMAESQKCATPQQQPTPQIHASTLGTQPSPIVVKTSQTTFTPPPVLVSDNSPTTHQTSPLTQPLSVTSLSKQFVDSGRPKDSDVELEESDESGESDESEESEESDVEIDETHLLLATISTSSHIDPGPQLLQVSHISLPIPISNSKGSSFSSESTSSFFDGTGLLLASQHNVQFPNLTKSGIMSVESSGVIHSQDVVEFNDDE